MTNSNLKKIQGIYITSHGVKLLGDPKSKTFFEQKILGTKIITLPISAKGMTKDPAKHFLLKCGTHPEVIEYFNQSNEVQNWIKKQQGMLQVKIQAIASSTKEPAIIHICLYDNGGFHRSVYMAEVIKKWAQKEFKTDVVIAHLTLDIMMQIKKQILNSQT